MSYYKLFLKHRRQTQSIQKNDISDWLEDIDTLADKKAFLLKVKGHLREIIDKRYTSIDAKEMATQGVNESIEFINKELHEILLQESLAHDRLSNIESRQESHTSPKKARKNDATTAQQTLSILLLHHHYKLSKSQDKIPLQNFIEMLTGKNHRAIGDNMKLFIDNDMFCHQTAKQNLADYKFILPYFQKLELKEIVSLIEEKIKQLASMFAKS